MHDLTDAIESAHAALDERFYPDPTEEMVACIVEAAAPVIAAKALEAGQGGKTTTHRVARIHYSYGVNSGTVTAKDTPNSIRAAVEEVEMETMGRVDIDKIETRTVTTTLTPWVTRPDAIEAGQP